MHAITPNMLCILRIFAFSDRIMFELYDCTINKYIVRVIDRVFAYTVLLSMYEVTILAAKTYLLRYQ
jgi:hypothetical protein